MQITITIPHSLDYQEVTEYVDRIRGLVLQGNDRVYTAPSEVIIFTEDPVRVSHSLEDEGFLN